jgi:hypothetical protein
VRAPIFHIALLRWTFTVISLRPRSPGEDRRPLLRIGRALGARRKTLQELGYKSVYNAGAFKDLAEAGLETEPA